MDPNSTLDMINQALDNGDLETARAHFADLHEWVNKGGYLPANAETTLGRLAAVIRDAISLTEDDPYPITSEDPRYAPNFPPSASSDQLHSPSRWPN